MASPALVVGTDLSEPGRRALEAAAQLARDLGGRLVLVHAFDPRLPPGDVDGEEHRALDPARLQERLEVARRLTVRLAECARQEGLEVAPLTEEAEPVDLLLDTAQKEEAFLVVVGSHGRTGLERVVMGSVAERLLRHADRPVMVVPQKSRS